ncbi:phytanoyl-CoA dioxygenase family protein [Paenibacillus qinlingensis]|uniref:Ectoine hydroxylase-related dioxygenase (Phytanoyl-CoA dioxygenase family) n=1 Tax=Paenibacillus qinlingensis TaxID=1837343 RepID=A0ABU1NWC5_9BACL|nr:phytanoyl-CoA dioxygenase family protein [Paenibacillus qinlingensis]MDR6551753.1 ectoine hydroxylase-related dioxygenase (phytanoyl-CoA dioxygenase family) [Paenibacillus qinlingensis]
MENLMNKSIDSYKEDGYTIIAGKLGQADLTPMRSVLSRAVDEAAAKLVQTGQIEHGYEQLPFEKRWPAVSEAAEGRGGINWEKDIFTRELYELATHPTIINTLRPLLGEDIIFNGDFHIRPKLPGSNYFPWHQDSQYYGLPTGEMHIITVWIPFVDVNEHNGCLSMMPGSHTWGGVMASGRDAKGEMQPDSDPAERGTEITVPMQAGDMALFHNLTYHRSLPNSSDGARWSVDLRYSAAPREDMSAAEKEGYAFFLGKLQGMGFLTFTAAGPNKESWEEVERKFRALQESRKK